MGRPTNGLLGRREYASVVGVYQEKYHPQANGKIERFFGEVQRKLHLFEEIMMRVSDPVDLFIK